MRTFLQRAVTDPELSAQLRRCRTIDEFIDLAYGRAGSGGMARTRDDFAAELLAAGRNGDGLRQEAVPDEPGWLPVKVDWSGGEPSVEWCWLGRRCLSEPFFSDTIQAMRQEPFSRLIRPTTSLEALERHVATRPGLPLVGLIAHVSRCGSTLVSQMLASLPRLVVASEPPPVDSVLREGPRQIDRTVRLRWMRAMASALGQPREGGETGFVMKLDSWHLTDLPLVREAFPGVPRVILYREPAAVLASQMREPGWHMVGGALGAPFDQIPFPGPSQLEYRARVIGKIFEAAARTDEEALLVSYPELPEAVRTRIAPAFGIELGAEARERMRSAGRRDAKSPAFTFTPGADPSRQKLVTPELAASAERWAGASYRELELRRSRM